jgi:hypothetical protein
MAGHQRQAKLVSIRLLADIITTIRGRKIRGGLVGPYDNLHTHLSHQFYIDGCILSVFSYQPLKKKNNITIYHISQCESSLSLKKWEKL